MNQPSIKNKPGPKRAASALQHFVQQGLHRLAARLGSLINPLPLRRKKAGLLLCLIVSGACCLYLIGKGWQKPAAGALPVQNITVPLLQHHRTGAPAQQVPRKGHHDSLDSLKASERARQHLDSTAGGNKRHYSIQKIEK